MNQNESRVSQLQCTALTRWVWPAGWEAGGGGGRGSVKQRGLRFGPNVPVWERTDSSKEDVRPCSDRGHSVNGEAIFLNIPLAPPF